MHRQEEIRRIQSGKHAAQRVVTRHPILQRDDPLKPFALRHRKPLDIRPPLGTAHRRRERDKDHLDQIIIRATVHPRIGHLGKMFVDLTQQVRRQRFAPSSFSGQTIGPS